MSFIVAQKHGSHGLLIVVTDKEILGKHFVQGKAQLDLTKEFYQGEERDTEAVKQLLLTAQHIHLSGKKAVALGVELGLVDEDKILRVQGIPHAQVVSG